jgi:hypothetical protein
MCEVIVMRNTLGLKVVAFAAFLILLGGCGGGGDGGTAVGAGTAVNGAAPTVATWDTSNWDDPNATWGQ